MHNNRSILKALFYLFILGTARPWQICLAGSSDGYDDNGTKKTFYWEGSRINNLGRLGGAADFEEEQKRNREGKESDQYLASIREKLAHQAHADAQEKNALTYQGQLPPSPIELTYLSPGVRVTLHSDALFDENTAAMKVGAIETLDRLRTILETQAQKPLQFVLADRMDDIPEARNLDAERSLVVLHHLALSEEDTHQENLTPEVLAR